MGDVITVGGLKKLLKKGWVLTRAIQTIDGRRYWIVENDKIMQYRLVSILACDKADIYPK